MLRACRFGNCIAAGAEFAKLAAADPRRAGPRRSTALTRRQVALSTIEHTAPASGTSDTPVSGQSATEPAPLPRTWADAFPPRPKPATAEYGFLSRRGEEVASARGTLVHMARTGAPPPLVWGPETDGMVPPWDVPWLLDAMREAEVDAARRHVRDAALFAGAIAVACLLVEPWVAVVAGVLLAPWVLFVRRRIAAARALTANEIRAQVNAMMTAAHVEALPAPFTNAIGYTILAAGLVQLLSRNMALEATALDAAAVRAGEAWRLLTGPLLHGGVLHFWFNYTALQGLGRDMEGRGPRGWVPLVFVLAALAGGGASVMLPPDGLSVGASGGLMGMFGFLAVMAYRRKSLLPDGFLKRLMINIALIAVIGVVAYQWIDNAAHAGGLVAGALIGAVVVPGVEAAPEWTGGRAVELAGRAAIGVVWLSFVLLLAVTLMAAFG